MMITKLRYYWVFAGAKKWKLYSIKEFSQNYYTKNKSSSCLLLLFSVLTAAVQSRLHQLFRQPSPPRCLLQHAYKVRLPLQ